MNNLSQISSLIPMQAVDPLSLGTTDKLDQYFKIPELYQATINGYFDRWALDVTICLLDVWGLDTFEKLEEFGEVVKDLDSKKLFKEAEKELATLFIGTGIYAMVKGYVEGGLWDPKVLDESPFLPGPAHMIMTGMVLRKRVEAICDYEQARLSVMRSGLSRKMQEQLRSIKEEELKRIQTLGQQIVQSLDLFISMIGSGQWSILLYDLTIARYSLGERIIKNDLELNRDHMKRYMRFVVTMSKVYPRTGAVPIQFNALELCAKKINQCKKIDHQSVSEISSHAFNLMRQCYAQELTSKGWVAAILSGDYCRDALRKEFGSLRQFDRDDFTIAQITIARSAFAAWTNAYLIDFQKLFDRRIASLAIPHHNTFIDYFFNLAAHFDLLFNELERPAPLEKIAHKDPIVLSSRKISRRIQKEFCRALFDAMPSKEELIEFRRNLEILKHCQFHYAFWNVSLQCFKPAVLLLATKAIPKLVDAKKRILQTVRNELLKCDVTYIKENQEALKKELTESVIIDWLPAFKFFVVLRDVHYFLYAHESNPELLVGRDHEIAEEMVDLVNLTGVKELFASVIQELETTEEAQQEFVEDEQIDLEVEQADPEKITVPAFSIAKGEKVRLIRKRLEELGFQSKSINGDHLKLVKAGEKPVILPLHRELKPGTAKSIENQVNRIIHDSK